GRTPCAPTEPTASRPRTAHDIDAVVVAARVAKSSAAITASVHRRRLRFRQRLRLPSGALRRLLLRRAAVEESDAQHILDVLDEVELHVALDRLRHVH